MRSILGREHLDVIPQLAWSNLLLGFDFDGTLAPIVPDRDRARMRRSTRDLLAAVCARYPCAVISGRGFDDVRARLDGVDVPWVIGNHGIEPSAGMSHFEDAVRAMRPALEAALGAVRGVEIEDKRFSLALHYRRARARGEAREAIVAAVRALPRPTRVVMGKMVVNVLPDGAPHKGVALLELRARVGADVALYVGDDVTDEDVFEMEQPGRLVGVRVGRSPRSAASFYVEDQRQVDALLRRLVEARAGGGGAWSAA